MPVAPALRGRDRKIPRGYQRQWASGSVKDPAWFKDLRHRDKEENSSVRPHTQICTHTYFFQKVSGSKEKTLCWASSFFYFLMVSNNRQHARSEIAYQVSPLGLTLFLCQERFIVNASMCPVSFGTPWADHLCCNYGGKWPKDRRTGSLWKSDVYLSSGKKVMGFTQNAAKTRLP